MYIDYYLKNNYICIANVNNIHLCICSNNSSKYIMYRLIDSSVLFMIGVVSFVIKVDSRDRFELKNVVIT